MILTAALIASAVAVFFWPASKPIVLPGMPGNIDATPHASAVSYQTAMAQLATVRLRLLQTEQLSDAERKSIDTLTLALVAGSDR
jgi:hypothetical protein